MDVEGRALENGDTVNLDYAGSVDGVAFEGGTAEGQTLTLGSNQFIPGFEEQMVGMNIGEEKDLNVTFPEQYHAAELAGKEDYLKYTGQTVEQLADMYKGEAEQRVKMELTLEAIRKAEGVEPTEEDVQKQIAEQAERMGQKVEDFEKTLTDEQRGYLKDSAAIQKVVELLKKDCKVEEKKPETEAAAEDEVPAKKAPAKRRAKKAEAAEESKDAE